MEFYQILLSLNFLHSPVKYWLLLLIGISAKSPAQIHISENTIVSVKGNTIVYMSDENSAQKDENKIHAEQTIPTPDFQKDPLIELAYEKKQTRPKKAKISSAGKIINKPSQPPMAKKDTETENRNSVLSFTSRQKEPVRLFYSDNTAKAALVHSGSFGVKLFQPKKYAITSIYYISDSDNRHLKYFFTGSSGKPVSYSEEYITRPPPFLTGPHTEAS